MMQMGFYFAPTGLAEASQALQQNLIVLLGWIKIGVYEWPILVVTPCVVGKRVFAAPTLDATFLLILRRPGRAVMWDDRRLKVVGQHDHQMNTPAGHTTRNSLPRVGRKPTHGSSHFLGER
jgi:hypothetical protein